METKTFIVPWGVRKSQCRVPSTNLSLLFSRCCHIWIYDLPDVALLLETDAVTPKKLKVVSFGLLDVATAVKRWLRNRTMTSMDRKQKNSPHVMMVSQSARMLC